MNERRSGPTIIFSFSFFPTLLFVKKIEFFKNDRDDRGVTGETLGVRAEIEGIVVYVAFKSLNKGSFSFLLKFIILNIELTSRKESFFLLFLLILFFMISSDRPETDQTRNIPIQFIVLSADR